MCMYVKKLENSKESEESGILYYLEVNKTNKTENSRFLVKLKKKIVKLTLLSTIDLKIG